MLALRATVWVGLLWLSQTPQAPSKVWERKPAPGITYRMEIEANPGRIIHALRFDRTANQYWATSSQAVDETYDLKPNNGRATLSTMVKNADAIGGVNGDFFQWGDDPGGDPSGLMVRNGELLSHPGGTGARTPSIGWGQDGVKIADKTPWTASVEVGGKTLKIEGLNEYARANTVTLATASAGYAISKVPATFVFVRTSGAVLKPNGEVRGTVLGFAENQEKIAVPPGTMTLMARGAVASALRSAPVGAPVKIKTHVDGYDFRRIENVIGGGPVLVRKGALAPEAVEDVRHPRTAMGVDKDGNLWYAIVDGRQTMSVGATFREMGEVMRKLGCVEAINLDGGGSSTMMLFGTILNRPSGGTERAIGNGILWHGPAPKPVDGDWWIDAPEELKVGQTLQLIVPRAPSGETIWTCQGAAWIDQDGNLRPIKEGIATVQALVGGRVLERKVKIAN